MAFSGRWRPCASLIALCLAAASCSKDSTTGPTPPSNGMTVLYSAVGASDVTGIGSSSPCLLADCPGGKGYVFVAANQLRAQGYAVTVANLGIPAGVISPRLQALGQQYGGFIPGNFISNEMNSVQTNATLVTVFAGPNDVGAIIDAVESGAGGSDRNGYLDQQIAAFRTDYATLLDGIRARAPSARIVVFNLPNFAGVPLFVTASSSVRQAAQRLSVGITGTVVNPLVGQGISVIDLMCDLRFYQASTFSSDGFHPNDTGYRYLADEVVRAFTSSYPAPQASCPPMALVN
jgi:lysophospholipase L1-like esterase